MPNKFPNLKRLNSNRKKPNLNLICTTKIPTYNHYNLQKENTLCMEMIRDNIMISFREELQFMNGVIGSNIPVRRIPQS